MSVDRIDSSKGYIIDNIRWIHKDINVMKNSFSDEYFTYLCKLICGIETDIVTRSRYRRSEYIIKLKDSNGKIYTFSNMISVKKFIDEFNEQNKLNGSYESWME